VALYHLTVIKTFKDKEAEKLFHRKKSRRFSQTIQRNAYRKLLMIDAAEELKDLKTPPANRLEALKGDRQGQHSIRINDQYRICFVWRDGDAHDVEIVDYH
jgi:proteic killer suppression protein